MRFSALSELTSGAPTDSTVALYSTFAAGATPTVSGAPVLPTSALSIADYPALDVTPPTNSSLVKDWMAKVSCVKSEKAPEELTLGLDRLVQGAQL